MFRFVSLTAAFVAIQLALASPVTAAPFAVGGWGRDRIVFVDLGSRKVGPKVISAWVTAIDLQNDKEGIAYLKTLEEHDCTADTYRFAYLAAYGDKDQVIRSGKLAPEFLPIIPDTIGDGTHEVICAGKPTGTMVLDELDPKGEGVAPWARGRYLKPDRK